MKVLALDQATTTGWAHGTAHDVETKTIEFGKVRMPKRPEPGERLAIFRQTIVDIADHYKPDLIAYELPYWPRPMTFQQMRAIVAKMRERGESEDDFEEPPNIAAETLQFLQWVRGVLMETAAVLSIPTEYYPSSSWRKTAIGIGRAPKIDPETGKKPDSQYLKRAMIRRAKSMGYDVSDDNEADAIGILIHATCGPPAAAKRQADLFTMEAGLGTR